MAVKINKSFLGFLQIPDSTAGTIANEIIYLVEEKGLDISKCHGQGFDGAANMSGIYTGVQARIQERQPNAAYVHCAAHNLNLVLNDSVKSITGLTMFYNTMEKLYVFFAHSIKRWNVLIEMTEKSTPAVTLKRLCATMASCNDAISVNRYRYVDMLKALTKISLTSKKADERSEAMALKRQMERFGPDFTDRA